MNAMDEQDFAQRVSLADDAAGEVMSLAMLLQREFTSSSVGTELEWVRGVSIRLEALASVILSSLNDPNEPTPEIRNRFEGPELARRTVRANLAQGAAA